MENLEIARALTEVADLLEIQGSNPFRIRAYRNAVQTIQGLTRSLRRMVEEGEDLTELPAIGQDMSDHIEELIATGELQVLREIAEEVPPELAHLLKLDGVGPKKVRKLWQELGVTTVEELEQALDDERVRGLEGFGRKSAEKIRRSIADYRKHQGRLLLSDADELVRPLLEYLKGGPGVERIEVAGSYRRRRETVGDLDILALCEDEGARLMDHFASYQGVERVESGGDTRGTVVLRSGVSVDLRILPRRSFGAALHYFTGSKEHNVEIRKIGVKEGLRINEYGVFRVPEGADPDEMEKEEGERIGGETEEEVFGAVGLPWIPPELRQNRGEIQAARKGELPDLVTLGDIRGDLQMHSTWTDGKNSILEMARACKERGYDYMALTDHSQAVTMVGGLTPEKARDQWKEIDEARERVEGFTIFRSCEVDILKDGSLDLPDEILEELDLVLVSVHSYMNLSKAEQTARVVKALEHPLVDILAHPTGRLLNQREPYEIDVEEVLEAAVENDVAVELNANPNRLDLKDVHVSRARELGLIVAIDTDAHSIRTLDFMSYGVEQARRGWLEKGDVLNAKSVGEIEAWLERGRS